MEPDVPQALSDYMEKAPIALALGAADLPDQPLIAVNPVFCRLTGYDADEATGRNCRFLQPDDGSAAEARARMRAFLDDPNADAARFEVANIRKDGSRFLNMVFMSRLRSERDGRSLIFASQYDLTRAKDLESVKTYDRQLGRGIDAMSELGHGMGLVMRQSAFLLSQSAATIAGLKFNG